MITPASHRGPALRVAFSLFALAGLAEGSAGPNYTDKIQAANLTTFGEPGHQAHYKLDTAVAPTDSTVSEFILVLGTNQGPESMPESWTELDAVKANGMRFRLWFLGSAYPPPRVSDAEKVIKRYILQEGTGPALEFLDRFKRTAILPSIGAWSHLMPRPDHDSTDVGKGAFPRRVRYLGLSYTLAKVEESLTPEPPGNTRSVHLLPDVLIGTASNTRQKDERRRYDNSDYELVRLTARDYREMFEAGMNCFKVDAEQLPWVQELDAFYWGIDGPSLPYPECLYRSTYLGPTLFLDEPAVGTRDYVIRPRLAKDEAFRKEISPQAAFEAFQLHFREALTNGAPQVLFNSLKSRAGANLGAMQFRQENLFSWETMVSTAVYQLTQDPAVPAAMVFEPPGRVGAWKTLPELDMTYGCQLRVDDPRNLIDVIYAFLRGAARLADKSWGASIYGSVDRTDAFWFLAHAYDLGATRFFFWDNARSACVPYGECLALARNLYAHVQNYPTRDLPRLKRAAEMAILLPPGYNLGHVQLGKGNLWGLGELNLERTNRCGIPYRTVMSNFFMEIERCLRQGVAFDLLWDLPDLRLADYREIVRVREDGKMEVRDTNGIALLDHAREPARPGGKPPILNVELSLLTPNAPAQVTAEAEITETSAPVYYMPGPDAAGTFHNAYVAWELYGPQPEDYRSLTGSSRPHVLQQGSNVKVEIRFSLNSRGTYRLRAATVDLAGRSTVVWRTITVSQ